MTASVPAESALRPMPTRKVRRTELATFPTAGRRLGCLAIVVVATVVLYYQFYLAGAVAAGTDGKNGILVDTHMSFVYYVNIAVVGYILGAVASFVSGIADRIGRVNIITIGLVIVALLCLLGIPLADSKVGFAIVFGAIGLVEGVILVATPALIRDFSPQLGRASAMGFWTLGPVIGSLIVSIQVSSTSTSTPWHHQYIAAGVVGLVVAALSFLFLRELTPELRDQVQVSERDRVLIEARAKGIDIEAALKNPFRQMLKPDIVLSAFAISVFLIIYYIAVGFFPVYFQTVFGYSQSKANGLGNYIWAFDAVALLVIGYLSDKLRVRKPFMVVGAIGAIVMTVVFATRATHPDTSYTAFAVILSLLAIFLGVAYAPWMASFTETVEKRNPALTATGLAVWGLVIRIVIAVSVFIVPHIVTTVSTLVEDGPRIAPVAASVEKAHPGLIAALKKNPDVVAKIQQISVREKDILPTVQANIGLVTQLSQYQTASQIPAALLQQAISKLGLATLTKLATPTVRADLTYLQVDAPKALGAKNFQALTDTSDTTLQSQLATLNSSVGQKVSKAADDSPKQWRNYFWIAVGGEIVFIPLIFLLTGFWSPKRAKQAEDEHQAMVERELAELKG